MRGALPNATLASSNTKSSGSWFANMAAWTAACTGKPSAFLIAVAVVFVWAVTGPMFNYSDTWQLVINTGTTIVTFLMVFLIQNTQNRDTRAFQIKLAELILAIENANNDVAAIEDATDEELDNASKAIKHRVSDGSSDEAIDELRKVMRCCFAERSGPSRD
jgi:low affinity Fe/Cu permease